MFKQFSLKKLFASALPIIFLALVMFAINISAWTEPGSAPPAGNVAAPINVSSAEQTKAGNLKLANLYLNATANEGDIYSLNTVQGYNDLFLKSNSAENTIVYISGSALDFWSGGLQKWSINSSGVLTAGSIPWARLTSFPSACPSGQFVRGVGLSLTCGADQYGGGGGSVNISPGSGITVSPNPITDIGTISADFGSTAGKVAEGDKQITVSPGTGSGITVSGSPVTIGAGGTVTVGTDSTVLQKRVSGTCAVGSSIKSIAADGTVTCETDSGISGCQTKSRTGYISPSSSISNFGSGTCAAEYFLTGGGADAAVELSYVDITQSIPSGNQWLCGVRNNDTSGSAKAFECYAVCCK